jgi:hypothetical protein
MSTLVTDPYNVSFSPTTCYRQCRRKRVRLRFIFQFTRPAPEVTYGMSATTGHA